MISIKRLTTIYKLTNIVRYNNKAHIKNENVAEHSFYVALMTLMICEKLKVTNDVLLNCLIKAILHDMPEIELNDITHDVKAKLDISAILEKYEDEYYEKEFPMHATLMNDKTDKLVNAIVKLADTYSVLQYCLHEKSLGNQMPDFDAIQLDAEERIKKLKSTLEVYNNENNK